MAKKILVVVESPTKAKKIQGYLGAEYLVIASFGHIVDLPPKKIGVDIKKDFKATYEVMDGREDVAKKIIKAAKLAKEVILMGDPDREGHAISVNIAKYVLTTDASCFRAASNEIKKTAILKAIAEKKKLEADALYDAYEARRILDRVVGFKCSFPVQQATGGKSAGRVQSAALRFLADREKEIQSFVPQTYWDITAELLTKNTKKIVSKLVVPQKLDVNTKKMAETIVERIEKGPVKVSSYDKKEVETKPYAPFSTSTLQQSASSILGWSPKKTMSVAQSLFEQSYITYHRTDSKFIVQDVVDEIRDYISSNHGEIYRPSKQWHYAKSKNAQEAHESIRPTEISTIAATGADQNKLYQLIWKRTVASQMSVAKFARTKAEFSVGKHKYILAVNGSSCTFDGWLKVWTYGKQGDYVVPELTVGDKLDAIDVKAQEEQTKPPSRFTEASCVKQMEKLGIGRPSTFSNTLETLKNRSYIEIKKKAIHATKLGITVTNFLVDASFCFVDLGFTAQMEEDLDEIANAKKDKLSVLKDFYEVLKSNLSNAKVVKEAKSKTTFVCPLCKKDGVDAFLLQKHSKFGSFFSCENYKKDGGCSYTANVGEDGKPKEKTKKPKPVSSGKPCPKCKADLVVRHGKYGDFLGCEKYPSCKGAYDMDGKAFPKKKKWKKKK